jgi:DNA-binding NarL/FixJ family response regulator
MIKPDSIPAGNDVQECKRILIASDNIALVKHYANILKNGFVLAFASDRSHIKALIADKPPQLIMIDPAFNSGQAVPLVTDLAQASPGMRILVISSETISSEEQATLLKAGAHGFCKKDTTPALLTKAIQLVSEGEFWLQRKHLAQLIRELASGIKQPPSDISAPMADAANCLTPRELEVAQMVHKGNNNKNIARVLDISERTVKAHLSAIFRKLNIDNRLQLALFFNKIT